MMSRTVVLATFSFIVAFAAIGSPAGADSKRLDRFRNKIKPVARLFLQNPETRNMTNHTKGIVKMSRKMGDAAGITVFNDACRYLQVNRQRAVKWCVLGLSTGLSLSGYGFLGLATMPVYARASVVYDESYATAGAAMVAAGLNDPMYPNRNAENSIPKNDLLQYKNLLQKRLDYSETKLVTVKRERQQLNESAKGLLLGHRIAGAKIKEQKQRGERDFWNTQVQNINEALKFK